MNNVTVSTKGSQVESTPSDFFSALENRFGKMKVDLAADSFNAKCNIFISKYLDSLDCDWWRHKGNLWLNPPFRHIEPWVKKAYTERTVENQIFVLIPSSLCTNWYRDWVDNKCMVHLLQGRLKFDGHSTIYPKELMLLQYKVGIRGMGFWDWKLDIKH